MRIGQRCLKSTGVVDVRRTSATWIIAGLMALGSGATAQQNGNPGERAASSVADALRQLNDQVRELQSTMAAMRADSEREKAETRQLRQELEELRASGGGRKPVVMEAVARTESARTSVVERLQGQYEQSAGDVPDERKTTTRAATLDEEYELLSGKVDDQYQTKVESASKYRMRLSGIVLMNMFSTSGSVDSIDLPILAYAHQAGDSGGSFGATLRQSEVGLEVFGPRVAGARTRGQVEMDFAGGFATLPNGISSGLMRLRTATMRMDWANTSVIAGQDGIFFSPSSPTSFATLAEPAFSYSGNLWGWVPQIRVEHRFVLGESSNLLLQGGILDPFSGEVPLTGNYRQANAGEASRQPAYATRAAWTHTVFGKPLRLGVAGFYSRQDYGYQRTVDAWAGMTDVEVPLGNQVSFSGKFYRGRGLGGLYGGIGRSALFSGPVGEQSTDVIGLNSLGGWGQLKYRPAAKLEFNAAFGMDNPYARDLEYFPYVQSYGINWLARNRTGFANVIYRPRSDVLFSAEYRRLTTFTINNGGGSANHLNLMMGVLF